MSVTMLAHSTSFYCFVNLKGSESTGDTSPNRKTAPIVLAPSVGNVISSFTQKFRNGDYTIRTTNRPEKRLR